MSGPTVVIDTFRAFSTAAYLVDSGVDHIVLAETLDEARTRARAITIRSCAGRTEVASRTISISEIRRSRSMRSPISPAVPSS